MIFCKRGNLYLTEYKSRRGLFGVGRERPRFTLRRIQSIHGKTRTREPGKFFNHEGEKGRKEP
jgi:hypothetical protein